jgi:universal stress protein E
MMMNRIKSVLVIAERSGEVVGALQKACILARHFGATIELFACDAEHAYMAEHAYDTQGVSDAVTQCLADSRRFLQAVRSSIAADDLEIRTSVACETPLHAGIVRKVLELMPDIVIRCVESRESRRHSVLNSTDWQLLRTCPVPLMLTRGRAWHPVPRIAAGVDLSGPGAASQSVLAAAAYLAGGCGGDLEIVYSEPEGAPAGSLEAMHTLAAERDLLSAHLELLRGPPERTLRERARGHELDVIVLGALSRRTGVCGDAVGTLTESLIESLDCDFLLVRHEQAGSGLQTRVPAAADLVREA